MAEARAESEKLEEALPSVSNGRSAGGDAVVRTVGAGELLGSSGLLRIDLDGEIYTLRLTRNHRLILTK